MSTILEKATWPACTSALQLDRLALGELGAVDGDALRGHLADCPRCSAAEESLQAQRAEPLPPLRLAPSARPPTLKLVRATEASAPPSATAPVPRRRLPWR